MNDIFSSVWTRKITRQISSCLLLLAGITTAAKANECELYPIALSAQTLAGIPTNTVLPDSLNGTAPGNFGWLTWTGNPSVPTLVASLMPPGDSFRYINPDDSSDHIVSIGDWVSGKPGVSNSKQVRDALDKLKRFDIIVPVWDLTRGQGANAAYRIIDFAKIRLLSYQLPGQSRISARYLGQVTCGSANQPPIAQGQHVNVPEDQAAAIILAGTDPEGAALTYSLATQPAHGTLAGIAPALTYTPSPDYYGSDAFSFIASDGMATSSPATVEISVSPVNDSPTADPQSLTTAEDTPLAITLTGTDIDADALSFAIESQPEHGTLSGIAPDLTYTPTANYSGADWFNFSISDGTTSSSPAAVTISIAPVNDAPIANAQTQTTPEDQPLAITLTGLDIDADALSFAIETQPEHGTLSGTVPNLTYTPAPNYNGPDSFTFTASDSSVSSVPAVVNISVSPVNDPPIAAAQSLTTAEDMPLAITLTGSDIDADALSFAIETQPEHGTLSGTAPDLAYTPNANYNGPDSFTFSASDSSVSSVPSVVNISVSPVNDAPIAAAQSLTTAEDTPLAITLTGADIDVDALSFAVETQPEHGTLSGTAPDLTYTPNPDYNGPDFFTFSASDLSVTSVPSVVNISVSPVNDAPIADAQSLTTAEDMPLAITLTGSDIDVDALSFAIETQPEHGTLSGTAPDLAYTPNANYNGADSFAFAVSDGALTSAPATVEISITPVNDAPIAAAQSLTTAEDTPLAITLTGTDIDADALSFAIETAPEHGTLFGTAPDLTYTPAPNYNGPDAFTFSASDLSVTSVPSVVTISVSAVNDPPTAAAGPDQLIDSGQSADLSGSATDIDTAPDALQYTWLQVSGPGSATFTPVDAPASTAAFSAPGIYVLQLQVSDAEFVASDDVTIQVNAAPVVNPGDNQVITGIGSAQLAAAVTDDNLPEATSLQLAWCQVSGPGPVVFNPPDAATSQATFPVVGDYVLRLYASDTRLAASADLTVSVQPAGPNQPPLVFAGADQTIGLTASAALEGSVSDDRLPWGASVITLWELVSGPGAVTFADATLPQTQATFPAAGVYVLRLSATDGELATADEVALTVYPVNLPPRVDAGLDQTLTGPETELTGWADDDSRPAPGQLTATWTQLSGPGTAQFSAPDAPRSRVDFDALGAYTLRLTATDGEMTAQDDVVVTVSGHLPPAVDAGPDQTLDLAVAGAGSGAPTNAIPAVPPVQTNHWIYDVGVPGLTVAAPHVSGTYYGPNLNGLATAGDELYVAGTYKYADDLLAFGLARWDGCGWSTLCDPRLITPEDSCGLVGTAYETCVDVRGAEIFVIGGYHKDLSIPPDGRSDNGRWDGTSWREWNFPLAYPVVNSIKDICARPAAVYVGGSFIAQPDFPSNAPPCSGIVKWNGMFWEGLGQGLVTTGATAALVNTIAVGPDGSVYAGGKFTFQTPSGGISRHIARWNGAEWEPMGAGLGAGYYKDEVRTILVSTSGVVYVGGSFALAEGVTVNNVAMAQRDPVTGTWTWSPLGDGANNTVDGLAFYDGSLYACGNFTKSGSVTVNRVMRWDGASWRALGSGTLGMPYEVYSAAVTDDGVYFGGIFTTCHGLTANRIVKWGKEIVGYVTPPEPVIVSDATPAGAEVSLTAQAGHRCGRALTLTWNVDGGPAEATNALAAGATAASLDVSFTNFYAPGIHQITITLDDGITPPQTCTTFVTILAPAMTILNGSVTDDGMPLGVTNCLWTVVEGSLSGIAIANPTNAVTSAAFSETGVWRLRLTGDDSEYFRHDDVIVTVRALGMVNFAPSITMGPDQTINLDDTASLRASASDDGLPSNQLTVAWTQAAGPGVALFSAPAILEPTATFTAPGDYVLRLSVSDGEFAATADTMVHVLNRVNEPPTVTVGPATTLMLSESNAFVALALDATVTDDGLPYGALSQEWSLLDGPNPVSFRTRDGVYSAIFTAPGLYTLRLAADDGRASTSADLIVTVLEYCPAPIVTIESPADGDAITCPTPVIGTVASDLLDYYCLLLRPVQPGQDPESGWQILSTGTAAVVSGELGMIDPTLSLNGSYELRLAALDQVGRATVSEPVTVAFEGNMKVGLFTISFSDLKVPLSGLPLEVVRTYDSRAALAGQVGDFGAGWTLSLADVRLRKNRPLASRWKQEITGFVGSYGIPRYSMSPNRDRIVTITMPDNQVYRFRAVFSPAVQTAVPIVSGSVTFEPLPGTLGSLAVEGGAAVRVTGDVAYYDPSGGPSRFSGFVSLIGLDLEDEFEPQRFRFTTKDGMVMIIHEENGLEQVWDRNGNEIVFAADGIYHSSGEGIHYTRDAAGRIASIIDPDGRELVYAYDASGDLVGMTDRTTNTTTFVYGPRHLLEDVLDARGVRAVRCEYDAAGRMIRQTDADGHPIEFTHEIEARRETIVDRLGKVTVHEYDDRGNVVKTTDPLGGVTLAEYDEWDNKLIETDPLGYTTVWTYDANNNQTSETDDAGRATRTDYDAFSQPVIMTDAKGYQTRFQYDEHGNLTNMIDAAGTARRYAYDIRGNQTAEYDAMGHVTASEYDLRGRLTRRTDPEGAMSAYAYDRQGNQIAQSVQWTGPAGVQWLVTSNFYDNENRLIRTVNPDGTVSATEYNSIGKESARSDELGRRTQMEYNDRGELVRTVYPDGAVLSTGYDAEGRKVAETNQAGFATRYEYDALGRLVATIQPDGAMEESVYDIAGRVVQTIDALGNVTGYGYEDRCACPDRRTTVTNTLGQVTRSVFDENGNLTSFIDANGHTTGYVYDELNRRTQVVYHDGTVQVTTYDALGRRVAETDQAGITTTYGYDANGRLVAVTNAINGVTRYEYDELGNQTAQIDANGHVTRYQSDARGRRTQRSLPAGQSETYAYDDVGNLTAKTDFNGKTTVYAYDAMNQLLSKTPDPAFAAPAVQFTYDARGLRETMTDASGLTEYQYDSRDRLVEKAAPNGSLWYEYDAQGNLTNLLSSNAQGAWMSYTYDELNRLRFANDHRAGLTMYNYDNVGNLADYIYPNGVSHAYQYDPLNRLTNLTARRLTTPLESYAYTLGTSGHRLAVQEGNGRRVTYQYDNLYRLTQERILGASVLGDIAYDLDPVGNRIAMNSSVLGIPAQVNTFDANDRLASDQYDANGNTAAATVHDSLAGTDTAFTYTYDFENRILSATSVSSVVAILYDGDGNRVQKTVTDSSGTRQTRYMVDDRNLTGYSQVLEEHTALDAGPWTLERVYAVGLDQISQTILTPTNAVTHFYGYDGHGSVRFLTDESGYLTDRWDYDAFGNTIARSGATPNYYLYCGEQRDEDLGLYFLRARYMSPERGRFWSMDSFEGSMMEPLSLHKYLYANSSPLIYIDPSGKFSLLELKVVQWIQKTLRVAFYTPAAAITGRIYLALARHVNAFALKFSETISNYDRAYYESRLLIQEIINYGAVSRDPGGLTTAVRYVASGTYWTQGMDTASRGIYTLVIDLKTRTIIHFLFASK